MLKKYQVLIVYLFIELISQFPTIWEPRLEKPPVLIDLFDDATTLAGSLTETFDI